MKKILSPLLLALLGYAGVVGYFYVRQDALIFPRVVKPMLVANGFTNPGMQVIGIGVENAMLYGVLLPPLQKPAEPPLLVLAFGGNADDATGFATFLKNDVFRNANVTVAAFSYRGYPNALGKRSTGTPTEAALEADALQEYDLMTYQVHPARVAVIGYSLGSAVAAYVAHERPVSSLVLVAPFSSMTTLVKSMYPFLPVKALLKYPFDTETRLKEIAGRPAKNGGHPPLTIFYSPQDGYIPNSESFELAHAYPAAKLMVLDGRKHGDILNHADLPADLRKVMK